MELLFKDITVSLSRQPILLGVSGFCRPGEILAILGPTGSGKTTLLNVLAGRILQREQGSIWLDGHEFNKSLKRKIVYVMQQDIFFNNLTLRQSLRFMALLRLPDTMPYADKMNRLDEICETLDLRKCLDVRIGDSITGGLSGGEKKLANIATELLTNPELMYVDEPTTGLDSSHAYDMMRMLKSYTEKERKTVVITIHQPSSQIFHMFDKILLLSEGQVAYFGERNKIISYFSNLGLQCAPHYNPADFVLQVVASSSEVHAKVTSAYIALKEVTDEFEMMSAIESLEQVEETESVIDMLDFGETLHYKHDMAHRPPSKTYRKKKQLNSVKKWYTNYYDEKWPTSFWTQYKVLTLRNFLQAKDKILSKWSAVQVLSVAMMVGLVWYQLDRKEETLKDREGVLFFTIIYWMFNSMMGSLTTFPEEREVLNKERSAGAYRLSAYYLAKLTSEFPLAVTLPTIYLVMVFPMVGLNGIIGFAGMWCGLMANALAAEAFGLCAGAYFLDQTQGITVCVTISLFYLMMGGFYAKHVPIWLSWGRYLSPPYYAFNAFIIVEFTRAAGFTCGEHNSIFEECSVDNVTTITAERVLEVTHDTVPYAYDTIFLVGYMLTFYVLGYLVLRYLRNPEKLFIMKKT